MSSEPPSSVHFSRALAMSRTSPSKQEISTLPTYSSTQNKPQEQTSSSYSFIALLLYCASSQSTLLLATPFLFSTMQQLQLATELHSFSVCGSKSPCRISKGFVIWLVYHIFSSAALDETSWYLSCLLPCSTVLNTIHTRSLSPKVWYFLPDLTNPTQSTD